jgi:hypothetical protein
MKEKSRIAARVFTVTVTVFLLSLSCNAYAAPAAQKAAPQVQAAPSAASRLLNPNTPPKGTITINASGKANVNASTWNTGSYQYIQWTCNGTYSNLVDVTLWQNNSKVVVIGTGIATGQTAYTVPWDTRAGQYELRVTSEDDSRIEARQAVNIVPTTLTITTPKKDDSWYGGGTYQIAWQIQGTQTSANLSLWQLSANKTIDIGTGITGGNMQYTVPLTLPPDQYFLYVNGKDAPGLMGAQHLFITAATMTITQPQANSSWAPGQTYPIAWQFMGNPGPLKIEFFNASGSFIIADNVPPGTGGSGFYNWKVISLQNGSYQVRITGQSSGAPSSASPPVSIINPYIKYTWAMNSPAPYAHYGTPFTIHWASFACGDKVDINITDSTANKNTIASNTAEAVRGKVYLQATQYSLSDGSGQYVWIPPAPPDPTTQNRYYYIQLNSSGGCQGSTYLVEYN